MAWARSISSGRMPWPSLPTINAQFPRKSARASGTPACAANAYTLNLWSSTTLAVPPTNKGTRKTEPADARMHLGLKGFTVPFKNNTPVAWNASAARSNEPALPGS